MKNKKNLKKIEKVKKSKVTPSKISSKPIKKVLKKISNKPISKNPKISLKSPKKKILTKKTAIKESPKNNLQKNLKKKPKTPEKIKKELPKTSNTKNSKSAPSYQAKSSNGKTKNRILPSNSTAKSNNFSINSFVVYPSHGVGKIINIETSKINQIEINCYLIYFEKEKLTIRIPINNVEKFNIRSLVSKAEMEEVFSILRSGIKKMKGMWSRRAQEYETKINSGDIVMLAEVIRDLTRDIEDSERSYSERIIYETAIFRLACEYSAIYGISVEDAQNKVLITAKDKLESDSKNSSKHDDFDDFDKIKNADEEDEDEDEEEEEEDDDFNYEYSESDEEDDDDDDDKPKKKKK
jgi:CarD family transcriptional regulator